MIRRPTARFAACLMVVAATLAGCSAEPVEAEIPEPFSDTVIGVPSSTLEFSGNRRGHRPGEESTFVLTLRNDSGATWEGRYCIELLDRERVIAELIRQEFVLKHGESLSQEMTIMLPEDVAAGAYGLAIVVPERFASTRTIYVGEKVEDVVNVSWAKPRCR